MNRNQLATIIGDIQESICNECRAFEGDEKPGILLTIGRTQGGRWAYQSGDPQYHGPCYGMPYVADVAIHRGDNPLELADELLNRLDDAMEGEA